MSTGQKWTRRKFSQALGLSAAGLALARPCFAGVANRPNGLAFAGTVTPDGSGDALHVFCISAGGWQSLQALPVAAPGHLLLHPKLPVLYVLHDVAQWNHLPRGAVSTYAIDAVTGHLTLHGTQPLSLAATHPRHATFTANSSHLLVAAEHGGMYNLLPVAPNGDLLPVSGIRKEFGRNDDKAAKTAAPRTVALHHDGTLLAIDAGQESLTSFHMAGDALAVQDRLRVHAGDGPSHLALAPGSSHAYTLSAAGNAVAVHALHPNSGLQTLQTLTVAPDRQSLVVAPNGEFLLVAGEHSTEVLSVAPGTGRLSRRASVRAMGAHLSLTAGGHMVRYDSLTGELKQSVFENASGTLASTRAIACLPGCVSLVFRPAGVSPSLRRPA